MPSLAGIAALAIVVATAMPTATAPAPRIEGPFGRGADRVWILRPNGPVRAVVVFGHGWKQAPPSPSSPWVRQFRPWLDHLLARGSAIVFPAYQLGGDVAEPARVAAFRAGLQTGFRRLGEPPVPVVAVGYSYAGSLVFYYAAEARRWNVPEPAAVDSVFPVGPIPGAPVSAPPRTVRVLIEVGDRDVVAGRAGADAWWTVLRSDRAMKRLVTVRSRPGFAATHAAPKLANAAAGQAFWAPLDALVARAVARR